MKQFITLVKKSILVVVSCYSLFTPGHVQAQCITNMYYPEPFPAPAPGSGTYQIVTDQYQEENNWMTGVVAGHTFTSTASIAGTFITVRFGTFDGAVVTFGATPLNWTAGSGGTYFIHYNANAACATAQTPMTTTITNTTATTCTAPTTQASGIGVPSSGLTASSANIGWANGNGAGRAVYVNSVNSFTPPSSGNNPAANTAWANAGQQCIYNGTGGGPVFLSGLSGNTTYWVQVYEFCLPDRVYNTAPSTGNPTSFTTSGGGSGSPGWNCTGGNCVSVSQNATFTSLPACQSVCGNNPPPVDDPACKCLFRDMRFPDGVITQAGIVTKQAYAGEYAEYEVVAGTPYRWEAETDGFYLSQMNLTLYGPGGQKLACSSGSSLDEATLSWTATISGRVRVQLNEGDSDCLPNFIATTVRFVVNGFGGMAPQDDEFWEASRGSNELLLMPNPSQGELDVVTRVDGQLPYQVFNSAGHLVHQGQLMPYRTRLNLDLPSGLYTLFVQGQKPVRFIIQNAR